MNAKLGGKKRRHLGLLGRQPLCIFCGGTTPASTVDHQPARSFFDGRIWPEGYEFPACEPCNKKSKDHEHVLTTLVRLKGEGEQNAQREVDFAKFAKAMKNNFPGLLRVLGPDEKNGFIRSRGLWVPVGRAFPLQLPMVAIGNILPADATITVKWCTNAGLPEFMTEEMKAFVAGLTEKPTLVRNGKDLSDQFDYRYRASEDGSASMYFIKFRQSIFGAGVVLSRPDQGMEEADAARVEAVDSPALDLQVPGR
jgi:hypothetical protein